MTRPPFSRPTLRTTIAPSKSSVTIISPLRAAVRYRLDPKRIIAAPMRIAPGPAATGVVESSGDLVAWRWRSGVQSLARTVHLSRSARTARMRPSILRRRQHDPAAVLNAFLIPSFSAFTSETLTCSRRRPFGRRRCGLLRGLMGRRAHTGRTASNPKSFRLDGMASCATPDFDGRAPSQSGRRRAGAPKGRRRAAKKTQIKQAQISLLLRRCYHVLLHRKGLEIPPQPANRELSLALAH
jgi:hypothetical protein